LKNKTHKMSHRKLLWCVGVLTLAASFVTGCGVDCFFAGTAKAWVDTDKDGIWDPGEPPLRGVRFFVDDVRNDIANVGDESISDEAGEAPVYVWLPGCPRVRFEIYPEVPSGYVLTTAPRLPARGTDEGPFFFGFSPVSE
jgi:hypothetical protein